MRWLAAILAAVVLAAPAQANTHAEIRAAMAATHAMIAGQGRALLLGDSIIEGFWWNQVCGGFQVNAGIGGATAGVLHSQADGILTLTQPSVVLLMIGVNDARLDVPFDLEAWKVKYNGIVYRMYQSGATMILYTVMPVEQGKPLGDLYFDPARIVAMNAHIAAVAANYDAVYRDVWSAFQVNGFMPPGGTVDGVHPSRDTYVTLHGMIQADLTTAWARRGKPCSGF